MQKVISFLTFLFFILSGDAQGIDGNYSALELNTLSVDSSGKVDFYMIDSFPKERWFHEVRVAIKGNNITIEKSPVYFDSLGKRWYSASDGGFLTYKGKISKSAEVYIAKTRLADFDYIGFSIFEPPKIVADVDSSHVDTSLKEKNRPSLKLLRKTHDVTRGVCGIETFLPKGTLRQDFVIRPDKEGLWINNVFYYRRNGKALNTSFVK